MYYTIHVCMYVCIYLWRLTRRRVITPHLAGVTKHLKITKQMHISSSYSVYSAKCTNVGYISASVNIVKISLLIVSRQRHSSWNRSRRCAQRSWCCTTRCKNCFRRHGTCVRDLNESFKLIHEPIHWFANWFDQAFEKNWLKRMNHSWIGIAHCPEKSRRHVWNKFKHF